MDEKGGDGGDDEESEYTLNGGENLGADVCVL
jgi:hypothetical protein